MIEMQSASWVGRPQRRPPPGGCRAGDQAEAGATGQGTILVVDDDPVARTLHAHLLGTVGFDVASFDRPEALLASARRDAPCGAVIDLRMPGMDGLVLLDHLMALDPSIPAVIVTGHATVSAAVRAMKQGAVDFLQKPVDPAALRAAAAEAITRAAAARVARAEQRTVARLLASLTPRERQVCERVARGLPNKEIAESLGSAVQTVKIQRGRGMKKLGVESTAALVLLLARLEGRGRDRA
jgi:FixJ family two-component response regulator